MTNWHPAQKIGDTDKDIPAAKEILDNFSYGAPLKAEKVTGYSDVYTEAFGTALRQYGANMHEQFLRGKLRAPDPNAAGVFDWTIKRHMKIGAQPPVIVPPPPRIPTYCFVGTGGIRGLDPVSRICQRLGGLVEEIHTPWAATMGGIPVGATQGGIGAPSMWTAIQDGMTAAQNDFIARFKINPALKICIVGYSAGAVLAQLFREWVLANFPQCYIASVTLGDPSRPLGGGFFGRPAPWGNGIGDFSIGDPSDYRHAWLTHEKDFYAQIPGGVVGDIIDDIYAEVSRFAFSDPLEFLKRMISAIPTVLKKAGIPLTGALTALAGGPLGIIGFGLPLILGALGGLIPSGKSVDELTGPAAAAKAAVLALEFLFAGTGPHVRYEFDAAWPGGPTFVDFGAMHLRDYIGRLQVAA